MRLVVPLISRALGEDKTFAIVEGARSELGLGNQQPAWRTVATSIAGGADEQVEADKKQKATAG